MRKRICLLLNIFLICIMTGCGNNNTSVRTGNSSAGVNDVINAGMAEEDAKKADKEEPVTESDAGNTGTQKDSADEDPSNPEPAEEAPDDETEKVKNSPDEIDVDLTALSSTMVYAEVYNMMAAPEDYIGKTVKMNGMFASYHDEATDKYYFACVISDATACCSQGIEFVLTDEYSYPDDYPKEGEEVCVCGEFDTYQEGDRTYCTLRNAKML